MAGRDREIGVVGAKPQVATERDREPAADRDAAQRRDRRPIEGGERAEAVLDRVDIVARRRGVAIDLGKFRDVGAGAEMAAGALDDDDQRVGARCDAPRRRRARRATSRATWRCGAPGC